MLVLAVLCCAVLCCAVLCCAVLCCAVLCCAVLCAVCCAVLCAVLCAVFCAVLDLCLPLKDDGNGETDPITTFTHQKSTRRQVGAAAQVGAFSLSKMGKTRTIHQRTLDCRQKKEVDTEVREMRR